MTQRMANVEVLFGYIVISPDCRILRRLEEEGITICHRRTIAIPGIEDADAELMTYRDSGSANKNTVTRSMEHMLPSSSISN